MTAESDMVGGVPRFPLPLLEAQADLVEKHKVETLLFCPDPWALQHVFINQDTGEVVRARCNRWDCLYCGPRKVDQWRQLAKAVEPTLFLALTKAGKTVAEGARALTAFLLSFGHTSVVNCVGPVKDGGGFMASSNRRLLGSTQMRESQRGAFGGGR